MKRETALGIGVAALVLAVATLSVLVTLNRLRIDTLTSQLSHQLDSSTHNRALNVGTWCNAINQGRRYNRTFVLRTTHGHAVYTLPNLPCTALEHQTIASVKQR